MLHCLLLHVPLFQEKRNQNDASAGNTNQIRYGTGNNHQKRGSNQDACGDNPERQAEAAGITLQTIREHCRADQRSDNCNNDVAGRTLPEKRRRIAEHKRNDECADTELAGRKADFHRLRAGDCRASVGSHSDRRRNSGNAGEIEYEHVRLNSSKPHVDQSRSRHSSADDVGSGGWKTHAEDQRGDHRQNQRDQKVAVCNLDDKAGKFDTGARHIQNADNDTGRAAGAYLFSYFSHIFKGYVITVSALKDSRAYLEDL